MNQGEWELLHVLPQFREFSVGDSDYYAEMKFFVSSFNGPGAQDDDGVEAEDRTFSVTAKD